MYFILGFIIIIFLIAFICMGENGANHYCEKANVCPASVRCNARNKEECECFEEKRK